MADVIIIPGRGLYMDGSLPPDPRARVEKAVKLYEAGRTKFIVMSGAWSYHLQNMPTRTEARAMMEYAVELGVFAEDIIEEVKSSDTLGNAYFTKKDICEPHGWKDIIIVASDDHMARVKYLFEKVYGPAYHLEFELSERMIDEQAYQMELKHEQESLTIIKKWLDPVEAGNDAEIWRLMSTHHPAYKD